MRLSRVVALAFAAATVAAAAAGCGGGGGGSGGNLDAQTYAAEICSLALDWTAVDNDLDAFVEGEKTEADVGQAISEAQGATVSFVNLVRGLDEPQGETEQEAYASLQETADALDEHSRAITTEANSFKLGEQSGEEAAAAVKEQIDLIYGDLRTSVKHLDAITDTDLTAIVRDDQSCRALGL